MPKMYRKFLHCRKACMSILPVPMPRSNSTEALALSSLFGPNAYIVATVIVCYIHVIIGTCTCGIR